VNALSCYTEEKAKGATGGSASEFSAR